MFRAGLYARVSTNDQQTLAMQNRAIREYALRRGWTIALQVREVNSRAVRRKAREKLLEAARRREIDLVLVWRLDRWGRSVTDLLATLQELEHLGVGFPPGEQKMFKSHGQVSEARSQFRRVA
jgi:DNA invertase Pin-like site-specific DNA recombinase